jgi:hypothetical protein
MEGRKALDIGLVIQTIRGVPSRSDAIDEAPNMSGADPSGPDQSDAEHQSTDMAVGAGTNLYFGPSPPNDAGTGGSRRSPARADSPTSASTAPNAPTFDGSWQLPDFEQTS